MTGLEFYNYVLRTFKRTDKETEVYEAMTDVIQLLQTTYPFDDFKTIKTDSTILTGNSFSLPSDFLQFVNKIVCIDTDSGWQLNHISASKFERLYAYYNANTSDTGTPADYCVINGTVYVGPRPDQTTYTYRYVYEQILTTEITSATANVPFTQVNRKMLKHFVLGALYQDLENELYQYHNSIAGGIFETLVSKDKHNTQGTTKVQYTDI